MDESNRSLTNVQLEILKAFSFNLENDDLEEFRDLISSYFAQKAIKAANKAWDDNKVEELLNTKLRSSS